MKKLFTLFKKKKKLLFIATFLLSIISVSTSWAQTAIFNPSMSITPYGSVNSNGSEGYANSIDNNINTKFLDNNSSDGIGFTVNLGDVSKIASSISVTTANDTPGRDPKNYEVLGSNDGSNFTSIATGIIQCISTRFSTRFYCFENSTAYKYYRVNFTNSCSGGIFQFAEVQLYTPGPGIGGSVSANQSISGVISTTPSGEANLNSGSFVQIMPAVYDFDNDSFTPGQTAAQSFKTSNNVILNAIKINVAEVITAGSYTLTIFQGEGTSGTELMNQVVSITNSGTNTFALDATLALIGEQSYTFKLETSDGNAKFNWINSSGSDYSSGSGYTNGNNNNSDFNFQLVYQNNVNWQSVTLTGFFGGIQKWQKASDSIFSTPIDIPSISATLEPYLVGDILQTTYFRAVVGCSSVYSDYVTIAVISTNTTNTTTETACASYTWSVNGTTYITSGTYTSVMGSNTEILNLTINTPPLAPTAPTTPTGTTTICSGSSLVLTASAGTTYLWSNGATTESITVTTAGNYSVRVTNANGCQSAVSAATEVRVTTTWTGAVSTAWNTAGNWSCDAVPDSITDVTIAATTNQPVISSDVAIKTVTLNTGTSLTISTGFDLTVTNYIHNSGTLTVENNANLIQIDAVTNTGNIIVKRKSAPIVRLDHTLWSAPVTGQNLFSFSPATLTNRFYTYATSSNAYINTGLNASSTFEAGKGFAIRAPNNQSTVAPIPWEGTFTGVPNNGTIPFTLNATIPGYNLVGNPYPSTIDAVAFVAANPNITGTLYFYAHSLSMNANGVFPEGTNYAVWNSTGPAASTSSVLQPTPAVPNGIIQVGQGFFVKATGAGTINFTNAMRVTNNANQFLRSTTVEKNRLWLNLKTGTGTDINQILVGYITGATQGVESNYDGLSFGNTGSFLSSKIDGADYAIQGRSLPFDSSDIVPLGFKAATAGNYTIALTNSDGLFAGNQEVFLQDNLMGITHDIIGSAYSFSSQVGTFDARFALVYTNTLGVEESNFAPNSVKVYKEGEWFRVKTNGIVMQEVRVFDLAGRLIFKQSGINDSKTLLEGLSQVNQMLLVKIISQENQTITVKVIN